MVSDSTISLLFYIPIIVVTIIVGLVVLINSNETNIWFNLFGYGIFCLATLFILVGFATNYDFLRDF